MASTMFAFRIFWLLVALKMTIGDPLDFSSTIEKFSGQFYKEVASQNKENVIMSPISADLALTMVGLGSTGKTLEEIEHTLGVKHIQDVVEPVKSFIEGLSTLKSIELLIANKVYPKKSAGSKKDSINPSYQKKVEDYLMSEVEQVDFSKKKEAAATINDWVESKTNHRITNLIDPDSLDSDTAAVLVSAIYFKGKWAHTFKKDQTKKEDFTLADGSTVKVDMMHTRSEYWYQESPELDAKIINIPYQNKAVIMTIILPNKIDGLDALADKLSTNGLTSYLNSMTWCDVILSMPKTRIETSIDLKDIFAKLGSKRLFSPDAEINELLDGESNLYVSKATQKAFIEIDEEGSEAAAASGFQISLQSAIFYQNIDVVTFNANHPFYFVIMKSGTIVFAGNKKN